MSATIRPDNEKFIDQEIAVGAFRDRTEAINAGVDLLRRRKALLDMIDEGRRQLDEGDYVEYDDESLARRFEELKERVRSQQEKDRSL